MLILMQEYYQVTMTNSLVLLSDGYGDPLFPADLHFVTVLLVAHQFDESEQSSLQAGLHLPFLYLSFYLLTAVQQMVIVHTAVQNFGLLLTVFE